MAKKVNWGLVSLGLGIFGSTAIPIATAICNSKAAEQAEEEAAEKNKKLLSELVETAVSNALKR